jgi:hypothetical protein
MVVDYPRIEMRPWFALALMMLAASGCAGPHSSGAVWAQQDIEQEAVEFTMTAADRAARIQSFELSLADEALASERSLLTGELQLCPGPAEPLGVSPGDKVRDGIRVQAQADAARISQVAQLALADWYVRRAAATSDPRFCADAESSLTGARTHTDAPQLLSGVPPRATVTRDPRQTPTNIETEPPMTALSSYALGYVDALEAATPLPQYLGLVYGGSVIESEDTAVMDAESAAALVDEQAGAYPQWEPDALYAALRGGTW